MPLRFKIYWMFRGNRFLYAPGDKWSSRRLLLNWISNGTNSKKSSTTYYWHRLWKNISRNTVTNGMFIRACKSLSEKLGTILLATNKLWRVPATNTGAVHGNWTFLFRCWTIIVAQLSFYIKCFIIK